MRMKQHSEGTQCERPSLFPRAVSVGIISQFTLLYFKEAHHILRQHTGMSEAAVHSQKQPGFQMTGGEKRAQLRLSGANPSGRIPECSQRGWGAEEGMLRALSVPDILVGDLGVAQVEPHDSLLPQALCVQLEARGLLETRSNLPDQLPLRVWQPHHLWGEPGRAHVMANVAPKSGNTPAQGRGFPELAP